jgi:hypothetical protein
MLNQIYSYLRSKLQSNHEKYRKNITHKQNYDLRTKKTQNKTKNYKICLTHNLTSNAHKS